jgi:hypothetical protein
MKEYRNIMLRNQIIVNQNKDTIQYDKIMQSNQKDTIQYDKIMQSNQNIHYTQFYLYLVSCLPFFKSKTKMKIAKEIINLK